MLNVDSVFVRNRELEFRKAAWKDDTDTMISLWGEKVDIDSKGEKSGQTAAHRAAKKGHNRALHLLFNLGADLGIQDVEGKTPEQLAEAIDTRKLFECIRVAKEALAARQVFYPKAINLHVATQLEKSEREKFESKYQPLEPTIQFKARQLISCCDKERKSVVDERISQFAKGHAAFNVFINHFLDNLSDRVILSIAVHEGIVHAACQESTTASFVYLTRFQHIFDFAIEKVVVRSTGGGHLVIALNRKSDTDLYEADGWKEALILDPQRERIFFYDFVEQYSEDTVFKFLKKEMGVFKRMPMLRGKKWTLMIGNSNQAVPSFLSEFLPKTYDMYRTTMEENEIAIRNTFVQRCTWLNGVLD